MGRAGVRSARLSEGDVAALVALRHRVIFDGGLSPSLAHGRVGAKAELGHEAGFDPVERPAVEITATREVVKSVGTDRSPVAVHFHYEDALRSGEFHLEFCWGLALDRKSTRLNSSHLGIS